MADWTDDAKKKANVSTDEAAKIISANLWALRKEVAGLKKAIAALKKKGKN